MLLRTQVTWGGGVCQDGKEVLGVHIVGLCFMGCFMGLWLLRCLMEAVEALEGLEALEACLRRAHPGIHPNKKREDDHLEVGIEGVALNPNRQ